MKYPLVKNKRIYTLYKISFPNGKIYIGYTSRKLKYRIREHELQKEKGTNYALYNAMRKYDGKYNIKIINTYFCKELAVKIEMVLIKKYETSVKNNGYNISHTECKLDAKDFSGNKNNRVTKEGLANSIKTNSKKIIDSNGKLYSSIAEAGRSHNRAECTIRDYIKHGYNLDGKRFAHYNGGNYFFKIKITNKIKCLNNNKIYNSANEVCNDLNLPHPVSVNRVCRNERNQYKGYMFDYVIGVI